jgi:hypothetical protein
VAIISGTFLMLILVVGILYFLYARLQQLDARDNKTPIAQPVVIATPMAASIPAAAPVPALPTPLPLQDLPVMGKVAPESMVTLAEPATASKTSASTEKLFSLGSIVCENNDCLALINGHTTRVGDVVKGFKVTAIGPSSVTMRSPSGESLNLSLFD